MAMQVEAVYENGVLRPLEPIPGLVESERVMISIQDSASAGSEPDDVFDHEMVREARARVAKLERIPTLEEVQKSMSSIPGSMSDFISQQRGEY